MTTAYPLPPMLCGSAETQLRQLRDYLVRLARELPTEAQIDRAAAESVNRAAASGDAGAVRAAQDRAKALKALIVKTADEVSQSMDRLETRLSASYLAKSEFGDYAESVETRIVQTARDTVESYGFSARLDAADADRTRLESALTQLGGEIRRGVLVDPDTQEETLGLMVSQELRFTGATRTEGGVTYAYLEPGQTTGVYTSTGWQFWIGGVKRGWFDARDGMLHVVQLVVEDSLRLGPDWLLSPTGGLGIRYIGN